MSEAKGTPTARRARTKWIVLAASAVTAVLAAGFLALTWPAASALVTGITGGHAPTLVNAQSDPGSGPDDSAAQCSSGAGDDGTPATADAADQGGDASPTPDAASAGLPPLCSAANTDNGDPSGDSTGFQSQNDGGDTP